MTSHTIIYYLRPPPPSKLCSSSMLTVLLWLAIFFHFFRQRQKFIHLASPCHTLLFLIQTYFHFRVIFTCLRAQQLPTLIKRRCMEGPALKWKLSEVQLLRLRATFHTLPYFTYPRKFYTRKHANISRRRKSTLTSIKLNRAISWTFPPPSPRHPFTCPSKRVTVCVMLYPAQTSHLMQMNKNKRKGQNRGERKIGINRKISMSIPVKDITVLQ